MRPTFDTFRQLLKDSGMDGPFDSVTTLLGCVPSKDNPAGYVALPGGLFTLLLVLWKFIILLLTGSSLSPDSVGVGLTPAYSPSHLR